MSSDIKNELIKRAEHFENILKDYLLKQEGYAERVIDAMNYSLLAGGKRLRPVMMLEAFKLFSGSENEEVVYPFMVAMEMLHTSSLVHDDLPAMDNDEYRRGRKTTHVVYGPGMATLAGDGLLNMSYETAISGAMSGRKLSDYDGKCSNRYLMALNIFSTKAGTYGMIGGQCADMVYEEAFDIEETEKKNILGFIDENKTGALIEASLMIGAVLGGASESDVLKMEKIGSNIGIAFQIQDDILDIEGNQEELGKPIGSDIKNQKTTYVSLYGMDVAKSKVKELTDEALDILGSIEALDDFLKNLFEYLIYRTN